VDEEGTISHLWDPASFHQLGGEGQKALYNEKQQECVVSLLHIKLALF
jgi:hypothetical protein